MPLELYKRGKVFWVKGGSITTAGQSRAHTGEALSHLQKQARGTG